MNVDLVELKKIVKQANQRIARIENKYGNNMGTGAWGVKNLYDAIDNSVVDGISQLSGRIQIKKSMSPAQLKAISKATQKFLDNKKISTLKGITETKKAVREGIKKSLSNPNPDKNRSGDIEISDADAQTLLSDLRAGGRRKAYLGKSSGRRGFVPPAGKALPALPGLPQGYGWQSSGLHHSGGSGA